MTTSRNPVFHYLNGTLGFPAPFYEGGSMMYSFVFSSDLDKLQKVCDAWFNVPSGGEVYYRPLLPIVIATFYNNAASNPLTPPFDQWGHTAYQEVVFSILVVRLKKKGGVWIAEHVSAFVPYIFVDNMFALAAGREVYGMPKSMSWIDVPADAQAADKQFRIEAISAAAFSPGAAFARKLVAEVRQQGSGAAPSLWKDMETAFEAMKNMVFGGSHITLPGLGLVVEIAEIFLEQKLPFSSLRQLRAIDSSETAVYQAVVDFYARMKKFHGAGELPGDYILQLPQDAVYPIARDLGLRDGQKAESAFWLHWDFVFETGREVWSTQANLTFFQWLRERLSR